MLDVLEQAKDAAKQWIENVPVSPFGAVSLSKTHS